MTANDSSGTGNNQESKHGFLGGTYESCISDIQLDRQGNVRIQLYLLCV